MPPPKPDDDDDDVSVDSNDEQPPEVDSDDDAAAKSKKPDYLAAMGGDKDSDEEDDLYGGDAEEELEELQDVMIRKIQALYRKKRARALLKQLIKANYVKEYDEETGHFLYRNKRTGEKQFHKPMVLGSDDLEDPKVYVCPPEYSNEPSAIRYFGIVVTNAMFDASKIPPLDTSVVNDHNSLSELLSHPYKCKFREDDCIFLRDASLSAVVNSMESLQGKITAAMEELEAAQSAENDVYNIGSTDNFSTSSSALSPLTVPPDDFSLPSPRPPNNLETTSTVSNLSALPPSTPGSPRDSLHSSFTQGLDHDPSFEEFDDRASVNLQRSTLSTLLKKQPVAQQIGLFVYLATHTVTVQKSGTNDGMYFLMKDTSWSSSARVRKTSLSLTKFTSLLKSIPCKHKTVCLDVVHSLRPKDTMFRTRIMYPQPEIYDKVASMGEAFCIGSCMSGLTGAEAMKFIINKKKEKEKAKKIAAGIAVTDDDATASVALPVIRGVSPDPTTAPSPAPGASPGPTGSLFGRESPVTPGAPPPPPPPKPKRPPVLSRLKRAIRHKLSRTVARMAKSMAFKLPPAELKWTGDENGYEVRVSDRLDVINAMPKNTKLYLRTKRNNAWAGLKKGGSSIFSALSESVLPGLERALYNGGEGDDKKLSFFGSAVTQALAGEAAVDARLPYITGYNLYTTVEKIMTTEVQELNDNNRKENPLCPLVSQKPMKAGKNAATIFLAAIPSPPASPLTPYSVMLTDTAVHLKWAYPPFSGEEPIEYNLQARGHAKLNSSWYSVGTYAKISSSWFNVVHLVPGVALQFRVRAANHGGWGDWSSPSEMYRPYANPVMPIGENMQAAIAIGAREVLTSMRKYYTAMEAQTLGSKVLVTVATRDGGFKRGSVAKDCVGVALSGMSRFPLDSLVQSYGCLLLGWACFARPLIAKEAREQNAPKIIKSALDSFGHLDSRLAGYAQWALGQIAAKVDLRKARDIRLKIAGREYQEMIDSMDRNAKQSKIDNFERIREMQREMEREKEKKRREAELLARKKEGSKNDSSRGRSKDSSGRGGRGRGGRSRGSGGRGRGRGRGGRGRGRGSSGGDSSKEPVKLPPV